MWWLGVGKSLWEMMYIGSAAFVWFVLTSFLCGFDARSSAFFSFGYFFGIAGDYFLRKNRG